MAVSGIVQGTLDVETLGLQGLVIPRPLPVRACDPCPSSSTSVPLSFLLALLVLPDQPALLRTEVSSRRKPFARPSVLPGASQKPPGGLEKAKPPGGHSARRFVWHAEGGFCLQQPEQLRSPSLSLSYWGGSPLPIWSENSLRVFLGCCLSRLAELCRIGGTGARPAPLDVSYTPVTVAYSQSDSSLPQAASPCHSKACGPYLLLLLICRKKKSTGFLQ